MNIEFQKIETQGHKTKRLYLMFRNLMQTKNLNFYLCNSNTESQKLSLCMLKNPI
jgi:hypothetical protein